MMWLEVQKKVKENISLGYHGGFLRIIYETRVIVFQGENCENNICYHSNLSSGFCHVICLTDDVNQCSQSVQTRIEDSKISKSKEKEINQFYIICMYISKCICIVVHGDECRICHRYSWIHFNVLHH